MSRPIIEVKGLSKKYRISHQKSYLALRDALATSLKKPFAILRSKKENSSSSEDFWALRDISFDIRQGEVTGIIGRNGAGKTTLLKILSRITRPTNGEVRLWGRVGSLLEVGTGFHGELTGRENIYFNGAILGMRKKEIDKKFDEIVDFSGVEKFLDTPVKRFSSGMQVRLAFSVAAHLDPEILLIDEVLAVGDAQFQRKCLGKMKDISGGGRTILFVSHNMAAIRSLCSRTILLENGRLLLDTETETAVSYYLEQNLKSGTMISGNELESKVEGNINRKAPTVRLREIALLNGEDQLCNSFNSSEPIKIAVTYECLAEISDLEIVVQVVDEENQPILLSQNTDDIREVSSVEKRIGVYKSFCVIAPDTFGQRRFYISVHLINPRTEHLIVSKVLMFDVAFDGYNLNRGEGGIAFIRPQLRWETEYINDKIKESCYDR